MTQRIDYQAAAPEAAQAMYAFQRAVSAAAERAGLEPVLLELVKLRASYLNGCAFCVDMHTKDARAAGEAEQRLYAVPVWCETPFFTPRERAALAWAEAVTEVGRAGVPGDVYAEARSVFDDAELANLTWAVAAINVWNRVAVAFRAEVGAYVPGALARAG